jgi:DNA-binding response OmpR family regulator
MISARDEVPLLLVPEGDLQGSRWPLDKDEFLIGRGEECDLTISDRQVSRHHARIRRTPSGYRIEDLGSKNGTHLNGALIEAPELLQDGDDIQIALALKLSFIGSESTLPLSLEEAGSMGLGQLRMEIPAHRVWIRGIEIDPPLSPPQFRLLELLYINHNKVISRDSIAAFVWPGTEGIGVSDQAIDALVRRLRDRISEVDKKHDYVVTVRGHGFRLNNPV